jgi:hypothetical protein
MEIKNNIAGRQLVKCCWEAYDDDGNVQTYCSTFEDGGTRGKINYTDPKVQSFTSPLTSDDIVTPLEEGVLQERQSTSDSSAFSKNEGLLGLLNEKQSTIQPFGDTKIQKNNDDEIISNDNNNVRKQVGLLSLLEEEKEESLITETDNHNDKNTLKDEENIEDKDQDGNQIYCIRAPCPNSNSDDKQDQLSTNQEDVIQSEEESNKENDEQEEKEQEEQEQIPSKYHLKSF